MNESAQYQVPLGIVDLMRTTRPDEEPAAIWNHWYWCRRHECAEHISQSPRPIEDCLPDCKMPGEHVHRECIRIGPFMTKAEANRLDSSGCGDIAGGCPFLPPLGMEVVADGT